MCECVCVCLCLCVPTYTNNNPSFSEPPPPSPLMLFLLKLHIQAQTAVNLAQDAQNKASRTQTTNSLLLNSERRLRIKEKVFTKEAKLKAANAKKWAAKKNLLHSRISGVWYFLHVYVCTCYYVSMCVLLYMYSKNGSATEKNLSSRISGMPYAGTSSCIRAHIMHIYVKKLAEKETFLR